ncbi:MAG: ATPase [Veillonella sp.]|uniref:ATPase n=1 Tax=Veillonella sp. TaxID=1926307 RepID=UPI00257D717B|nr:ATPase [Veillonella sp.]MBS7011664.1 ATPase [Veillonella sp.]
MFSYKSRYCVAAAMAAMAALTGHVEARDIDLQSIGYFQFSPLPPSLVSQTDTLLLSDSPEYVGPVGGTLSAGTINGNGRIYFYHVNEMDLPHKIAIVLENQTAYPTSVHVMRQLKSVATPDYFAAGRDLSRKDLEQPLNESRDARPLYSLSIPPQGRQLIFSDLENTPVNRDALFTGIVDIKTEGPIFARVMMLPMGMDPVDASHWVKNLPIDEIQLRGTYTGAKRNMEVTTPFDTSLGGAFVEIGNDREDTFINGVDEMQNKAFVRDRGNYGVSYTLKIPTKGNEPFRLYFNPLGGPYSGSFTVKTLHQQGARRGQTDTRTYHIGGADGISALGEGTILDSRLLGNYNAGDLLTLNFMPAGASNLPIRFLLIPESLANPQKHQTIAVNVPKDVKDILGNPTQGGTQIPVGPVGGKDGDKGSVDTKKSTVESPAKRAEVIAHEETKKLSDKAVADVKKEAQLKKAKDEKEALARKKAEEARLAAEKAEMLRKAAEAKHAEIERKMAEKAEAERKAEEARKAEAARKAEMARIEAARKAEADRLEAARKAEEARLAAEAKRLEEERRIEAARIEAARKAEEERKAAEAKARFEAQRAAEKAALEAKKAEEERLAAEARARLEAQRKAEQEALEARRAEEARKAAEARIEAARKAEQARLEAEARRAEEARKAEAARLEAQRRAEQERLEAARRAEEARIAAEAKGAEEVRRAEEARRIEEARRAEEARKAEAARIAAEARKAEQERLAAERAEAERQAAEARRLAEERYKAQLEAERKAEAARQQALAQAEIERKAKERAEAIQRVRDQQESARRRAELARQQLEAERKAAQASKRTPSFSELDDIHGDTSNVTIPNAVSIDELTKPRPTASQNTRRREQRQPQLSPNQQYVQINPVANEPQQDQMPYTPQNEQQNDEENPPRLYPLG